VSVILPGSTTAQHGSAGCTQTVDELGRGTASRAFATASIHHLKGQIHRECAAPRCAFLIGKVRRVLFPILPTYERIFWKFFKQTFFAGLL
jgi:hypothetical protein